VARGLPALRQGMSLLELVVALAISAAAVSTAVAATSLVIRSRQTTAAAAARTLEAAQARDLVADMISGAIADDRTNGFHAEDRSTPAGHDDRLTFVTRHVPGRTTATAGAVLYIDRDPGSEETGLIVAYSGGSESVRRLQLVAAAESFNVRYFFDGEWQEQWSDSSRLPLAFEVSVDGERLSRLMKVPVLALVQQATQ
jgi:prepilin-type N-terminal cleavage/methylation domain-containing protein